MTTKLIQASLYGMPRDTCQGCPATLHPLKCGLWPTERHRTGGAVNLGSWLVYAADSPRNASVRLFRCALTFSRHSGPQMACCEVVGLVVAWE
jgi:hypothetical protein